MNKERKLIYVILNDEDVEYDLCLLYTSPSPRDA